MKKTDSNVRFCKMCDKGVQCKQCDKTFDENKHLMTTSFHQIKKDLSMCDRDKAKIIVDLGCPNSVIGVSECSRNVFHIFSKKTLRLLMSMTNLSLGQVVHTSV